MITAIILSVIGVLQIFQWIEITKIKRENYLLWNQIRDLTSNVAKQIIMLKNDLEQKPKEKPTKSRRVG
jgi:hypothetical protein